jgi:ADP-heptose:LPS heptosyltransferase
MDSKNSTHINITHNTVNYKVFLIKLLALGDILAFYKSLLSIKARNPFFFEFFWSVDKAYVDLITSLLELHPPHHSIKINLVPIETHKLFASNFIDKFLFAYEWLKSVRHINPDLILCFHRDLRYSLLFRLLQTRTFLSLSKKSKTLEKIQYDHLFINGLGEKVLINDLTFTANNRRSPERTIGLLIGGGKNSKETFYEKRWPHFAKLIELIILKTNLKVLLFGSTDDLQDFEECIHLVPKEEMNRLENHVGKTRLSELPSLIKNLDIFVSVDSGLIQLASLLMNSPKQKIIGLYGPTDPKVWSPSNENNNLVLFYEKTHCSPCYKNDGIFQSCIYSDSNFQICMKNITAESVFESIIR